MPEPEYVEVAEAMNRLTEAVRSGNAPASVEELREWWTHVLGADFDKMAPKIGEYTAADLAIMGNVLADWLGMTPIQGQEMACMFYTLGKVARAVAAYREGRVPSDDTLHDIVVYAMMARRIREVGGWPG